MSIFSGGGMRFALSKESSACTLSTAKGHVLPIALGSGFDAWPRQKKGSMGEVGTGQQPRPTGRARDEGDGSFTIPLDHTIVGLLLAEFLTDYTYSAGTPNTHTLKPGATDPFTMSLEAGDVARSPTLCLVQATGHAIAGVHFEVKDQDLVEITFDLVSCGRVMDWDAATSSFSSNETYLTNARYLMPDAVVKIDTVAVTHVTGSKLDITRNVAFHWVPNGSRWKSLLVCGDWSYAGNIRGFWDSGGQIPNFGLGLAQHTLEWKFIHPTTPTHYLSFALGAAQGFLERLPAINQRAELEVECTVEGYATSVVTMPLTVVLANTDTNLVTLWT